MSFVVLEIEMIVKSLSSKSMRFKQLLEYFNQPLERGKTAILHNLTTQTDHLKRIEAEFLSNSTYQNRTKNTITLYHEILSLGELDKEKITEEVLTDLATKYLELRAPNALAYGKYQYNTENKHIHLLISGNEYHSTKQVRLTKYDFQKIKQEMELYQKQRYPELTNSLIFDRQAKEQRQQRDRERGREQPDQIRRSWKEQERQKRYERQGVQAPPTRKEEVRQQLLTVFTFAMSQADFVAQCKEVGLTVYERRDNKFAGVETGDGYKYRFKTLGLEEILGKEQQRWEDLPKIRERVRQMELERLQQDYVKPLQFKEDIQQVLRENSEHSQSLSEERRNLIKRLDHNLKLQRARERDDFMQGRDRDDFGLGRSL